ncbi:NACHT domain-containing protein [Parachlamydia sp. AcF125]|uniref:NACHT domain-containing protein n=1 Tax=Parachlamydia sp. AcF125 TaxID=2795736 RepID=UPI001BC92488|nr:NACHT domain-containing protein [Parachlamydia sp. AcF125]MBS4169140.1 hypothetical protein [Parachlamydia sp. AcF125]
MPTKPGFVNSQASAKHIHLEQNSQLYIHAGPTIQYCAEPPLSQTELDPQYLINSLRNYYLSQETLSIFRMKAQQEWEFKVPLEEIYVRLAMIESEERKTRDQALDKHSDYLQDGRIQTYETIFKPKQTIELEKLFEQENLVKKGRKRIYLQGAAGSGKSTLCHYIAYRWAKGDLWQGIFSYLFWIPLRNLTLRKYPADKEYTPADLIAREYAGKIDRRVIEACIHDSAFREKTLFILDGYDELSSQAQGNTSLAKAFKELKELFPHILVTSRPGSCSFNRSCELELLGFDKEGVKRYSDRFFKHVQAEEKKQKLNHLLNTSPQVLSLAQIPINLTLLCCFFNESFQVFDTEQSFTMTSIYARVVNWMYKWFLLRRIDQGQSKQTKEQILAEKNLRQNPEVANIATAFEEMADFAMENNTLYLSKPDIEHFRGNKILSNELTDCGLMRIPEAEEKGYFIHLTFQEFLTASKIANQYLKGERRACQEFVQKYKFEPRYALVLRMIAGYISLAASSSRHYSAALQPFFDDLFAEPRDLVIRNEINLIAECFEECQDPTLVKQYEGFIELVKDYMAHLSLLDLDFTHLLKNKKIFNHSSVITFIEGLLSNPHTRQKTLINLPEVIRTGQRLATGVVRVIIEVLKNSDNDFFVRRLALVVLIAVAKQGDEAAKEAVDALIQVLKEGNNHIKQHVANALVYEESQLPEGRLVALIQILKEGDFNAKCFAANVLEALTQQGSQLPEEALDALVQILKEGDSDAKRFAADVLEAQARQGNKFSEEALGALIQILKEGDSDAKFSAGRVLKAQAYQGNKLPEEGLVALIQILKEDDFCTRDFAAYVLGAQARQGNKFSEEALGALIQALKEGNLSVKFSAADVLGALAKQGNKLLEEGLVALIQALKEDGVVASLFAANALGALAQQGSKFSEEALGALIQILKEGDSDAKFSAAQALGIVARQGRKFSEEALGALIQNLKEGGSAVEADVTDVLEVLTKPRSKLSEETVGVLIKALKKGDLGTKVSAAEVLKVLAQQGSKLPKEALSALVQNLKEGDPNAKFFAVQILKVLAQQGNKLPEEALVALVQILKEDNSVFSDIDALGALANQGNKLPKEALVGLVQMLKEGDFHARRSATEVLKETNKNTLLEISLKKISLITTACFFIENSLLVKDQKLTISDKRTTYLSAHTIELSYEEIREKLPTELALWRKRLDNLSTTESFQRPKDRV